MANEVNEQESGINLFDLIRVLFGRKILLGAVTLAATVAGAAYAAIVNANNSTYEGTFVYNLTNFNSKTGKYYDGSPFDIRDTVKLEKLESYKAKYTALQNVDMNKLYNSDAIQNLEWTIVYREVPKTDEITQYVQDDAYYKISIAKKGLSQTEAAALAKAIAQDAIDHNNELIENTHHTTNLDSYNSADNFENKISQLEAQYKYIITGLNNIKATFGNILVSSLDDSSLKDIESIKAYIEGEIQNEPFTDYTDEINAKYLVLAGSTDSKNSPAKLIEKIDDQIEDLTRSKEAKESEWKRLSDYEEDIFELATSTTNLTIENLSLDDIHKRLTELAREIEEIEKTIADLTNKKAKLAAIDSDNGVYQAQINDLVKRLNSRKQFLADQTNNYAKVLKEVYSQYSAVYFGSNKIVKSTSAVSLVKYAVIALAVGFVGGLCLNLVLDGKKLSKDYKEEPKKTK